MSAQQWHPRVSLPTLATKVYLAVSTPPLGLGAFTLRTCPGFTTLLRQTVQINEFIHQKVAFDISFCAKPVEKLLL